MIELESQPWVPKFLLKNFADSDGRVFRLNVLDDKITKLPPKRAAARPNFNELLVDGYPRSFEAEFERFETAAARPISEVIENQSLKNLNRNQRRAIAHLIAVQSIRTEAYRLGLQGAGLGYDVGTALGLVMDDISKLAGLIEARKWALMVTDTDAPFYLGDHPVVLQNTKDPAQAGELGLDMVGIEALMPLSPTSALYMLCSTISDQIVAGHHDALRIVMAHLGGSELDDFEIEAALPVAHRTLERAGPLYRAIFNGEPFQASNANVENLNYLQCCWASSSVFSNRSDFSFVKRVFRENPQYRHVMPVRLHNGAGIH